MKNKDRDIKNKNLISDLEIEIQDRKEDFKKGYDFVPREHHWTNISEQKVKVDEIEKVTDGDDNGK